MSVAFLFQGCDRQDTLHPYKWPAVEARFDSITERLEREFNDYAPFDSISRDISRLESLASEGEAREKRLKKSRCHYWWARYMSRIEDHASVSGHIKLALEYNDSLSDTYDFLRIKVLECAEDPAADGSEKYSVFDHALDYSASIGDMGLEALVCIQMGNLLGSIKEYDRSLEYLDRADSLNMMLGFGKVAVKNGINRAKVLEERGLPGDKDVADSIMKSLIDNPALAGDTATQNIVYRNIYITSKDKTFLLRAYNQVKGNDRFRHLRGLYRAMLANHNFFDGNHDSTEYYSSLAVNDLPYVKDPAHVAHIWLVAGLAWMIKDQPDSALVCRLKYEEYYNTAAELKQEAEVLRLNALNEISSREAEYRVLIYRRNMIIILISVVMIASAVILAFLSNRRRIRRQMADLSKELELEKSKRKMAANALTIEEKNNVLGALKQELSEMREDGSIKESSARHLESTIKAHLVDNDSTDAFNAMFDVVNPDFTARLRDLCPDIADSYVKLACYILMELDNKRIAALMMIRQESVRQARWRLSRKLGVPEGVTLESFLRSLNSRN